MPILLTNEEVTIEDKSKIWREVERFYTRLCTSEGSTPAILAAREELLGFITTRITKGQR